MKILMLTDKMGIGGAETHVLTLVCELLRRGHKVTLLSAGGAYADQLASAGADTVYMPSDKRDAVSVRRCARTIARYMRRCDVVHAHTRFTAFISNKMRKGSTYPPIAVTAHLDFPTFPWKSLSFFGDATLAVSEDIRDYLIREYGLDGKKIILTRNAIDPMLFSARGTPEHLIVHVSRIDSDRARAAFLLNNIAPRLLRAYPEYRIMIVGDGDRFDALREEVCRTNVTIGYEGVILTGASTNVAQHLAKGAIFVGVSRAALEAMTAGIPTVICGNDGYGGIVNTENFDALKATNFCARGYPDATEELLLADLCRLIDGDYATDGTEACRARILNDYSPSRMADDAQRCYESIKSAPRVCLMGYFGYSNLGDEVTLRVATEAIGRRSPAALTVLTHVPESPSAYSRTSVPDIIRAIKGCDVFVMCGGNLLQNETSTRSLLYYEAAMRLAHRLGKRTVMISSGFGGIRGHIGGALLARGISAADFCGCRTGYDLTVARACGSERCLFMPDLCFLLSTDRGIDHSRARKYFAYIPYSDGGLSTDELLELARERGLCCTVIILFEAHDKHLYKPYTDAGISCYFPKSYERIQELLGGAAFAISERLHGAIFSLLTHTPCYTAGGALKLRALSSEVNRHRKGLLLPYSKDNVLAKKEIGANDSDFKYVNGKFASIIRECMDEVF